MYRICICSKDEKDSLIIKETIIEENRGEMLRITDIADFNEYCAQIETDAAYRPDMLLIDFTYRMDILYLIERMQQIKPDIRLIFMGGSEEILLKPVTLDKILDFVNQDVGEKKRIVSLRTKRRELLVDTRKAAYIASRKHYVYICQNDKLHSFRMKMDECLSYMPDYFIRIHQSYAVNVYYIETFRHNKIELIDGKVLAVSRKYAAQARRRYREML